MKLLQLNIWHGRLIGNVLDLLKKAQPDMVCLQELASSPDGQSFFFDNLQEIQQAFDYPGIFFSPNFGLTLSGRKIDIGNAILSRKPMTPVTTVFTHGAYTLDGDDEVRNFQHAVITDGETKTNIINHHGFWLPGIKNGSEETTRQLNMIADYITKLEGGVIFAGDLNILPESPSLKRLNSEMTNLSLTHDLKTTRNFTAYNPQQVCDYIFVNKNIKVNGFKAYDDVVSDHRALELVFNEG